TLSITSIPVLAGQQFYVKVQGTDTTSFSTGAYALTLSFGAVPAPTVASPHTQTPNGNPLMGGGGTPEIPVAPAVTNAAGGDGFDVLSGDMISAPPPVAIPATGSLRAARAHGGVSSTSMATL